MKIQKYREEHRNSLVEVWEKSVRATHHFLKPSDIDYFKGIVKDIDFQSFQVYCSFHEEKLNGFIGVAENKIEMLFIDPHFFGKGWGKTLLKFGLEKLNATEVDVNEDNGKAVEFYSKFGFITYDRTEKDSQGKDFPILKMKLH
ncbi:GNAT family N-acetyltransferase [Marivirga sp. S37H4]|uniref:GNAT family N-acetyltransferase n=1 Tax=Marivirga aurantiaca TaxID=2802615 RepID=A0A935CCP0_9BACT|nr:GNAT family N-acetyltransferase [Marivirga aurantiaca]